MNKKIEEKKYSIINNVNYIYVEQFKKYKYMKWMLPMRIICEIGLALSAILIPTVVVKMLLDKDGMRTFLIYMSFLLLGIMLLKLLNNYMEKWMTESNSWVRFIDFAEKLIDKALYTDYENIERNDMQVYMEKGANALSGPAAGIQLLLDNFPSAIIGFLGMLIYGSLIVTLDFRILVVLILMCVSNLLLNRYARRYMERKNEENAVINKRLLYLFEKTTNIEAGKDIRAFDMYAWLKVKFATLGMQGQEWQANIEKRFFLPGASDILFVAIRDVISYGILIKAVCEGNMDLAMFTFFLGLISGFSSWLSMFINSYANMAKASVHINDYRFMLDYPDNESEDSSDIVNADAVEIEFRDVSFQYDENSRYILDHVSFKINPGEKLAIVGNNGAGKTTFVKLLCGFYKPTGGMILFNGIDAARLSNETRYCMVCTAFQDINLLAFNIAQNVSGKSEKETDFDKVKECLKLAGLGDKVDSLANKEYTYITQRLSDEGILLSGGESQKLVVARALYKNAPVFILDEPTSAFDPLAEAEIYQKYDQMIENKTSIFISHRLASTKFCDRILFLDDGKILEEGTHDSLMEKNGKYAEMFHIQSSYYRDNGEKQV